MSIAFDRDLQTKLQRLYVLQTGEVAEQEVAETGVVSEATGNSPLAKAGMPEAPSLERGAAGNTEEGSRKEDVAIKDVIPRKPRLTKKRFVRRARGRTGKEQRRPEHVLFLGTHNSFHRTLAELTEESVRRCKSSWRQLPVIRPSTSSSTAQQALSLQPGTAVQFPFSIDRQRGVHLCRTVSQESLDDSGAQQNFWIRSATTQQRPFCPATTGPQGWGSPGSRDTSKQSLDLSPSAGQDFCLRPTTSQQSLGLGTSTSQRSLGQSGSQHSSGFSSILPSGSEGAQLPTNVVLPRLVGPKMMHRMLFPTAA